MTNNSIKIGRLFENMSLLKEIVDKPGIYKVYVCKEDKDKVKFSEPTDIYPKPLQTVFFNRLVRLHITAKEYAENLQMEYKKNIAKDELYNIDKHVIYIGESDNLQKNIKRYLRMPFGGTSHRGGSDIWLISEYENLLHIEWRELSSCYANAKEFKKCEIDKFMKLHNDNLPVANKQ